MKDDDASGLSGSQATSRYRVIAASLLPSDVDEADRVATALCEEGWPHASRSFVIREAIQRLAEDLHGKTSREIFWNVIERRGRRLGPQSSTRNAP